LKENEYGKTIAEGDEVVLYLDRRRTYLVKVKAGKDFHTHKGFIRLGDLVGKTFGDRIESSTGTPFTILKPSLTDFALKFPRLTQIMYPKDIGLILAYTGIGPGWRVVEAGVGSGVLTAFLANAVRPSGRVYGYEVNERFLQNAKRNLERVGLLDYVEWRLRDVGQGILERNVDLVVLDLATPWLFVQKAWEALKPSGHFVSFSPTINQVERTVDSLRKEGFIDLEAVECILRSFKVKAGETRPETIMVGHTGYLVFARKASKGDLRGKSS
jgi:tRNA (adenine57-N1/adenine58-N1)-methyltransferase